jgi:phytoene dehydrogenase-like protein
MDYDAIVIGSGVGGCAAGAALSGAGMKVLVIEQKKLVGGRCSTIEKKGFKVDIGSHLVCRAEYGPFEEALQRVDMGGKVEFSHVKNWLWHQGDNKINLKMEPIIRLLKDVIPEGLLQLAADMIPTMLGDSLGEEDEEEGGRFDNVSIKEFVEKYTDNLAIRDIANQVGFIATWTPIWETSIGEIFKIFMLTLGPTFEGLSDDVFYLGYPKGGLISYPKALCEGISNKGGTVLTGTGIKRVIVENGKVTGVETTDGDIYNSDIVVSNAGIKETMLKLVGKEYFEDDYVKKIESLKPSWSVYCLRMALDKKVIDFEAAFTIPTPDMEKYDRIVYDEQRVPDDMLPHIMITSPSNLDPSLAPEGKQLIIAIGGCLYEPKENWSKWEEKILESVESTIPDIREHIIWKDFLTPGVYNTLGEIGAPLVGIAQSYDQVGKNRPSSISPVEGLYYVGCEAGEGVSGIGMELGTQSGLACADNIIEKRSEET